MADFMLGALALWPLWLALAAALVGLVAGWMLSTWTIVADAKDGHVAYIRGTAYRLIPVDLEHEYETEQRRQYGTMAEQSW